jgi:hypothetical protein
MIQEVLFRYGGKMSKSQVSHGLLTAGVVLIASILCTSTSRAAIVTFVGQDDGAPITGPFTNSDVAQSSFEAGAMGFGTLNTLTYESLAVGFYSPIIAPGVTITLSAPDFGAGFSGINDTTMGNLYGFNTTPSGDQWLGFPGGSATFTFSSPTNSFGTFLTGLQQIFSGTSGLVITFNDGTPETLNPPINVNGGAEYFGLTDTSSFTSLTITNTTNDAWGVDDTTFNGSPSAVPEPTSLTLVATGLGFAGLVLRRQRNKRTV